MAFIIITIMMVDVIRDVARRVKGVPSIGSLKAEDDGRLSSQVPKYKMASAEG